MTVDGVEVTPEAGETVLAAARRAGVRIPTLCHRDGLHPTGGCGVCTVEDTATGRLLSACATRAEAGMAILTQSAAAAELRRAALELLLGDHPADCEAPCQIACPSGLPVPELLERVAAGQWEEAAALAARHPYVCGGAAPCERACRRAPHGGAVAIAALHRWLAGEGGDAAACVRPPAPKFRSRLSGLTPEELLALSPERGGRQLACDAREVGREEAAYEARRCLQCGCRKPQACQLRMRCAEAGARQRAFPGGVRRTVRETGGGGFRFDSARCVLCGVCVRTAAGLGASVAPAFHGRGFDARVAPPLGRVWSDVAPQVLAACAAACPTGAMTLDKIV